MSINDTIRDLDDAREYYKRIKGFDKLARKLILGGMAVASGSILGVNLININFNFGILGGLLSVVIGVFLFVYVNVDSSYQSQGDRLRRATRSLRDAERAHERATMDGAS
jgi:hypothetical protein